MARINSTRTVKAALWALRIYLLILLTLIGIKFARVFSAQKANAAVSAPAVAGGTTNGSAAVTPPAQSKP